MPGNRSLDEFVAEEAAPDAEGDDGPAPAEEASEPAAEDAAGSTAEPLAETFAWSARGGTCASCGARVESRWRDGEALVCAACKAW